MNELKVFVEVKVSAKSLKQKFQMCEPGYIQSTCHGRCCEGSNGIMVTVHESEREAIERLGVVVEGGFIKDVTGCKICPLKKDDLCSVHMIKPFGCKASPFTLTTRGTLIVRNRYRMLRCYNTPDAVPAYVAHRWSLNQIFGAAEVDRIIELIEAGAEFVPAMMPQKNYYMLVDNDNAKHPDRVKQ